MTASLRIVLLASASLMAAPALAATPMADTDNSSAAAVPAAAGDDQSSSAGQTGQANDRQSLSSDDIIVKGSHAAEVAPITASLKTTQPQAAVSREYIDNANPSADFNELISLTPGVSISGTGNGQGFGESKATIRGFQDGEYNVTYDSIPFADTNNPTHHSTAFFPSNTIETVVVDRGPGNASQLGQATYGGNLNMYSRAVSDKQGGQVEVIGGIWNSLIARAEYQSGKIAKLNDAQFVLTGQFLRSDGALTNSPVNSKNLYGKLVLPIGQHNTLTIMSTWNRNFYYSSDVQKGATCGSATKGIKGFSSAALGSDGTALTQLSGTNCAATSQVGLYGIDYAMGSDPSKMDYWRYNRTDKTTDFSYLRLQSDLASGLSMDNRAYMYGYSNNTMSGNNGNVITGFTGAGTTASPFVAVKNTTDVLGYNKLNKYRVLGYIGQIDYQFKYGKIRVGGWYEHADTIRHLYDLDRTTGLPSYNENANLGTAATASNPATTLANIKYLQHSGWNQYQLFGEFEIRPFDGLSITPGIKYVHFTRSINGPVNQDASRSPVNAQASWAKSLPFATANWAVTSSFAIYGQYAQGMYVPDLSSFYIPTNTAAGQAAQATSLANLKPQTSTNYQIGTVWHGRDVSVDVDGYIINIDNKIASDTSVGAPSGALTNIGKVRYKGMEGQISYMPVKGLTLFTNASYNQARSVTTGVQIAKSPYATAAVGLFYNHDGLRVSFTDKYTGPQYATDYNGNPNLRLYRIQPYTVGEFAISQEIGRLRLGANVSNVFNKRAVTAISNSSSGAPTTTVSGVTYQNGYGQSDQFSFLPPRSFTVDARVKF